MRKKKAMRYIGRTLLGVRAALLLGFLLRIVGVPMPSFPLEVASWNNQGGIEVHWWKIALWISLTSPWRGGDVF